ncbi:hypothetical protein ACTG9Q_01280 [Actinokineospora sp. 24-640]
MTTRPARSPRLARGALLGACTGALAVAAHGMAGGGVPDLAPTLAIVALVAWAGSAVGRLGLLMTTGLLAGSQTALHLLLTVVAHSGSLVSMTFAHLGATLIAAVLVTRAGVALDALATAVRGLVRAVVAPPSSPAFRVALWVFPRVDSLLAVVLRVVCGRRGPPLFS